MKVYIPKHLSIDQKLTVTVNVTLYVVVNVS